MSELTQQQINQKRRQKILARSRKLQVQQPSTLTEQTGNQQREQQNIPLINTNQGNIQVPSTQKTERKQERDAFTRFRELQAKAQRQKYLIIFSKFLGVIVTLIQLYLMCVLKRYENKYNNKELTKQVFARVQQKFIDELDLIFWACFGTIAFSWIWIKFVRSTRQSNEKLEIIPGTTLFSLLEKLNKVLEYKVLVKALLGYTFTCIVLHLVLNQAITLFGYEDTFFKPNLALLLNPQIEAAQYEQIL